MKKITRADLAASAAERWKIQYRDSKDKTYRDLLALGSAPSPEQVDKVIGNHSWTRVKCDDCGRELDRVVQLGDEPDYESHTAHICRDCLVEALQLLAPLFAQRCGLICSAETPVKDVEGCYLPKGHSGRHQFRYAPNQIIAWEYDVEHDQDIWWMDYPDDPQLKQQLFGANDSPSPGSGTAHPGR